MDRIGLERFCNFFVPGPSHIPLQTFVVFEVIFVIGFLASLQSFVSLRLHFLAISSPPV